MSIASQIKPSKDLAESIYLLYDNGKFAGRTTDTKNALHFAQKTKAGKLKVEVKMMSTNMIVDLDIEKLEHKLKEENRKAGQLKRQATLAKKKAEERGQSVTGIPQGTYGAFA